jgi:hypothetical protein
LEYPVPLQLLITGLPAVFLLPAVLKLKINVKNLFLPGQVWLTINAVVFFRE